MEAVGYTITEKAQVAFSVMHFWAQVPRFVLIMCVILGAIIVGTWVWGDVYAALGIAIGGVVSLPLTIAILRFLVIPAGAKRAWRDFALIKEPVDLTLSEAGFRLVQPSATLDALWQDMVSWDEAEAIFAIYITRQQAYLLPKDQVGTDHIDYARQRLIESGLLKGRKFRK